MARGKGLWRGRGWLRKLVLTLFVLLVPAPILLLLIFPIRARAGHAADAGQPGPGQGRGPFLARRHLARLERAVIGSEDQNFCTHHGFDWAAINKAVADHKRHPNRPERGASTISQQTARTLFLVPVRSWVRKGLEAYLTVLVEGLWPKKRILTAYLNLVDWGDGIFGAEAASEAYFGTDASSLTGAEAARLAAILPNPHKWKAAHPGRYVRRRAGMLQGRSAMVTRDGLNFCVK